MKAIPVSVAVLGMIAVTTLAHADHGKIANVHVGLGAQGGTATGGCVAFDLVDDTTTPPTVVRYGIGGLQTAGPLYQLGILTHDGEVAGLDPQPATSDCANPALPSFKNLNFPPKPGQ